MRGEGGPLLKLEEVGSHRMHIWKESRLSRRYSSPRRTWTGARLGSGDPRGRPAPDGTPQALLPLAG